jgi:hypothetical protein
MLQIAYQHNFKKQKIILTRICTYSHSLTLVATALFFHVVSRPQVALNLAAQVTCDLAVRRRTPSLLPPTAVVAELTEEGQKEPKMAVKYKKVISRKKAEEQARTIIVSVPKEEEEMVDIGIRPKKRGRPRNTPGTDPPDPRKGSV